MAYAHAYPNEVYTAFSFLAFMLVTIPLPWHLEAWNTGTCLYMIWTAIGCLNYFINSIVWNGNAINWSPTWCDISARIVIAINVAIPAASLVINRRLYKIACCNTVTISKAEKRRSIMIDILIGVGLPIAGVILQYIPQGHRFDIFENVGCFPATYNTPVAIPTVSGIPVMLGLVSAYYSIRTIRSFAKRRADFKNLLGQHSNLNASRYMRLMLLAGIDTVCYVPFAIYAVVANTRPGVLSPWISWADTHANFMHVNQVPAIIWRSDSSSSNLELTRWLIVVCAINFFLFFGFADEAQKHYRLAYDSVVRRVPGYSFATTSATGSMSKTGSSSGKGSMLPSYHHRRHNSFDSLSDLSVSAPHYDEKDAAAFDETSISFGAISFLDAGGLLKAEEANSSTSSLSSPVDTVAPSLPKPAVMSTRPRSLVINVASIVEVHSDPASPHSSVELASPESAYDSPSRPYRSESTMAALPNIV